MYPHRSSFTIFWMLKYILMVKLNAKLFYILYIYMPIETGITSAANKESCQLAFAKRIRHVSKEMAKIILLKIF
jgi:hypothetical protein